LLHRLQERQRVPGVLVFAADNPAAINHLRNLLQLINGQVSVTTCSCHNARALAVNIKLKSQQPLFQSGTACLACLAWMIIC
jgi:hypothetical protein